MKKYYYLIILLTYCLNMYSQGNNEESFLDESGKFHLFESKNLTLDFKFLDEDKGTFGIDYKFDLQREIGSLGNINSINRSINFNFNSKGFITASGDQNQANSLITELKVEGFPLWFVRPRKLTQSDEIWSDVLDSPNLVEDASKLASAVSSPLWVFLDIHAKHETTQDFKEFDYALGSALSFSSSYLNALLDFPFGLIRVSENNNPRQLDFSVGYDYVLGIDNTSYSFLNTDEKNISRLNLKAEWETGIFTSKDRISFLFDSYRDLNATQLMKENNDDWNTFFMIKLEHILNYNEETNTFTKVCIKYTEGALPPNFIQGYVIGGGFSVEF